MTQKLFLSIFIAVCITLVFAVALQIHKKDTFAHNATVRYLQAGHTGIACEDVKILTNIFSRLISKDGAYLGKIEKTFTDNRIPILYEALFSMRQEMRTNPFLLRKNLNVVETIEEQFCSGHKH